MNEEQFEELEEEYRCLEIECCELECDHDKLHEEFKDMEDYLYTLENELKIQGNDLARAEISWSKMDLENKRLKEENEELRKPFERFDLLDL